MKKNWIWIWKFKSKQNLIWVRKIWRKFKEKFNRNLNWILNVFIGLNLTTMFRSFRNQQNVQYSTHLVSKLCGHEKALTVSIVRSPSSLIKRSNECPRNHASASDFTTRKSGPPQAILFHKAHIVKYLFSCSFLFSYEKISFYDPLSGHRTW